MDRSETWMGSLIGYLVDGTVPQPQDLKEAYHIKKKSKWFLPYNELLYKPCHPP